MRMVEEPAVKAEIASIYDEVQQASPRKRRVIRYRTVDPEEAARLKDATGIEGLEGYTHIVDSFGARHTFKKHGSERTEIPRGQAPVTTEDFARIPDVVSAPDRIAHAGETRRGAPLIRYEKRVNGDVLVVEEVRTGRRELALLSVWKRPAAPDKTPRSELPADTSETFRGVLPDEQSLPPPPKGGKTGPVSMAASAVNADAGGNYAGLVEQREEPPVGPAPPRAERGEPIRREDVLLPFLRALKVPVYEGRVRGARRLGFYLPKSEAVRIKRKSDLEVVAHEIAHLIDDRAFGGFARGKKGARPWVKGKGARELAAELREVSYDASKVYEGFAEFVRLWMTQPDEAAARAPKFHAWWERWVNLPASENPYGEALRDAAMRMRSWYAQHPIQRMASSGFRRMLLEDGRLVSGPSGEGSSGVARSGTPRWWAAPYFWPVRSERGALETSGENPLWKFGYMFVYWFLV